METFERREHMEMSFTEFEAKRQLVDIPAGRIAYVVAASRSRSLYTADCLIDISGVISFKDSMTFADAKQLIF